MRKWGDDCARSVRSRDRDRQMTKADIRRAPKNLNDFTSPIFDGNLDGISIF
jgi:hypothetical protein